jgi:hypothetical protein
MAARAGRLVPPALPLLVLRDVAAALRELHREGLYQLHVSVEQVKIDGGRLLLEDNLAFGVNEDCHSRYERRHLSVSPEMLGQNGERSFSREKSDVWALGMLALEAMTLGGAEAVYQGAGVNPRALAFLLASSELHYGADAAALVGRALALDPE